MSYYEVSHLMVCELCKTRFESPVLLPCGNTLCSKHITMSVSSKTNKSVFWCSICDLEHTCATSSLPMDTKIQKMLDLFSGIETREQYREALNSLHETLNTLRRLKSDPGAYMGEFMKEWVHNHNFKVIGIYHVFRNFLNKDKAFIKYYFNGCIWSTFSKYNYVWLWLAFKKTWCVTMLTGTWWLFLNAQYLKFE